MEKNLSEETAIRLTLESGRGEDMDKVKRGADFSLNFGIGAALGKDKVKRIVDFIFIFRLSPPPEKEKFSAFTFLR